MLLEELKIKYNNKLNPKLWTPEKTLKSKVKNKLDHIVSEFIDYLDVKDLPVTDIIITGSNANYNWTPTSDLDIHVVIDMDKIKITCPDLAEDFFSSKRLIWNEQHEIEIYGLPVELYVQQDKEPHYSTGIYSLKRNKWIKAPSYSKPSIDSTVVQQKTKELKSQILKLINTSADSEDVKKMKEQIKRYRQSGLSKGGEFSVENIVFKQLRKSGILDKLYDYDTKSIDNKLSLK